MQVMYILLFISRTVKRQCQTRRSPRYVAMEVIYKKLDKVIASLLEKDFPMDTKSDAGALLNSIQQFLFTSLVNFSYPILKSGKKFLSVCKIRKPGFVRLLVT